MDPHRRYDAAPQTSDPSSHYVVKWKPRPEPSEWMNEKLSGSRNSKSQGPESRFPRPKSCSDLATQLSRAEHDRSKSGPLSLSCRFPACPRPGVLKSSGASCFSCWVRLRPLWFSHVAQAKRRESHRRRGPTVREPLGGGRRHGPPEGSRPCRRRCSGSLASGLRWSLRPLHHGPENERTSDTVIGKSSLQAPTPGSGDLIEARPAQAAEGATARKAVGEESTSGGYSALLGTVSRRERSASTLVGFTRW